MSNTIRLGGAGGLSVHAVAAFQDPPITGPWVSVWLNHSLGRTDDVPLSKPIEEVVAYFQNFISGLSDGERTFFDPADVQFVLWLIREAHRRRAMGMVDA